MANIYYYYYAAELIALLVGSYFFKALRKNFLYLYIFVVVGVLTESWNILDIKLGSQNNLIATHLYCPLEFLLLALFYIPHLTPVLKKKWLYWIITGYMTFALVNPFFIQSLNEYSQMRIYSSIILVIFSLVYFYRLMNELKIGKLSAEPMVWINASVLIFYSVIFFYNILFNKLLEYSREVLIIIAILIGIFTALFYLLIAIGFWKAGKQNKMISA